MHVSFHNMQTLGQFFEPLYYQSLQNNDRRGKGGPDEEGSLLPMQKWRPPQPRLSREKGKNHHSSANDLRPDPCHAQENDGRGAHSSYPEPHGPAEWRGKKWNSMMKRRKRVFNTENRVDVGISFAQHSCCTNYYQCKFNFITYWNKGWMQKHQNPGSHRQWSRRKIY